MLRLRPRLAMFVALFALGAFAGSLAAPSEAAAQTTTTTTKKKKPPPKKKKKKGTKKKTTTTQKAVDVGDIDEPPPATAPAATGTPTPSPDDADDGKDEPEEAPAPAKLARPFNAEVLLGYGISDSGSYGFGFGLRGGYKLPMGVWIGGSLGYHVGQSRGVRVGTNPFDTIYSGSVFWIGPEGGYDFPIGPVVLRPFIGLGIAAYSQSIKDELGPQQGVEQGTGGARFLVWPGFHTSYAFSPMFYAALDLRGMFMVDGASAFAFYAAGGMRFGL